jgi:uncharacterized membrane protein
MSNLVAVDFDGIHTADEVLNKLRSLEKEYLIDLEDACVVERNKGGKVHIKQAVNVAGVGAAMGGIRGALWGTLVGLLFLDPLAGMAIGGIAGASVGTLPGSLSDYGIRDDFIRKLGETIPEGSSALFVLFRSVTEDKVLPEIEACKPRVLKTSLSNQAESGAKQGYLNTIPDGESSREWWAAGGALGLTLMLRLPVQLRTEMLIKGFDDAL